MIEYPLDQNQGFTIFLNDPSRQMLGIVGKVKDISTVSSGEKFGGYNTYALLPYDKIKGLTQEQIRKIKYHKRMMRKFNHNQLTKYMHHQDQVTKIYEQVIASHPKIKGHKRNE